jgi:hypothetical protein
MRASCGERNRTVATRPEGFNLDRTACNKRSIAAARKMLLRGSMQGAEPGALIAPRLAASLYTDSMNSRKPRLYVAASSQKHACPAFAIIWILA